MKKIITIAIACIIIACNKKTDAHCTPVTPESEANDIAAFCNAEGIEYTIDKNGIYYQIVDYGSGITPNINSLITVTYKALTLDKNVVEDNTTTPVTKPLRDFIEGLRIALPYIQKGGRIKIIVPSALAYGCTGIPNLVAPNSPLYYDVILRNVE